MRGPLRFLDKWLPFIAAAILVFGIAYGLYYQHQAKTISQQNQELLQKSIVVSNRHHNEISAQNQIIIAQQAEIKALLNMHSPEFTQIQTELKTLCTALIANGAC